MTLGEHARRFGEMRFVRRCDDFRQVAPIAAAQGRCVVNGGPANVSTLLDRLAGLRPERDIAELDPTEVVDSFADWVALAPEPFLVDATDPAAGGTPHWAPTESPDYRERMHQIVAWT